MYRVIYLKGRRPNMEDFFHIDEQFLDGISLYMVCDGHGGDYVSKYCVDVMPRILKKLIESGEKVETSLKRAFIECDMLLDDEKCMNTGTCCLVVLRGANTLWVANCGDTRAILNKGSVAIRLTEDHKPIAHEQERIERLGGKVVRAIGDVWRVNGELAVSRAIGDKRLRPYVIPLPDVYMYPIENDNKFCILASDGLWDIDTGHTTNKVISNIYSSEMMTDTQVIDASAKLIAENLVKVIEDNTTVVIVHLRR